MAARPPGGRLGQGRSEQVGELSSERGFALLAGASLILLGLAGSFGNALVGSPETGSLIVTGPGHDIMHLVLGALFLHAAVILTGRQRSIVLLALGGTLGLTGALSLIVPDLLGVYGPPTSGLDQLAHLGLGGAAAAIGWLAAQRPERRPAARVGQTRGRRR